MNSLEASWPGNAACVPPRSEAHCTGAAPRHLKSSLMKTQTLVVRGLIVLCSLSTATFAADVTGDRLNIGAGHTLTGTGASIAGGLTNRVTSNYSTVGGGYLNEVTNTYSFVGGGYDNLVGAELSAIGGGYLNTIRSAEAFIGGGQENLISTGSDYSTIGGGYLNTVSTNYAFIGGGNANIASGSLSVLGGGYLNTNAAYGGTIGGGVNNRATGSYSTVAGGASADASLYGQSAHANGGFALIGDAQASEYVLRNVTTTTNTTELYLDGTSQRMTLQTNGTWTFDIMVAVRGTNGVSGGYRTNGVIKRVSGTTTLVGVGGGSLTVPAIASDIATWAVTVNADTNNALVVKVKGHASTNRWVATVRTTEVRN